LQKFLDFYVAVHYVGGRTTHEAPFIQPQDEASPGGAPARSREAAMYENFETFQKISKDNVDVALKSFGAVSKGMQAIAVEFADYSKKSFEQGTSALEKLIGAKSLDKAIEAQTDYLKTAYEGFVAEATKLGELYADLAKETYKPLEGVIAKTTLGK
jgi:hypothetical protein